MSLALGSLSLSTDEAPNPETKYLTTHNQPAVAYVGYIASGAVVADGIKPNLLENINQHAEVSALAVRVEPPAPPETLPPPAPELYIPHYNVWPKLANCESGGDWQINTGNGFYGGLQFTNQSWREVGGLLFAPRADLASAAEQMLIAENLLNIQGWGAWPACSRKLGLR